MYSFKIVNRCPPHDRATSVPEKYEGDCTACYQTDIRVSAKLL